MNQATATITRAPRMSAGLILDAHDQVDLAQREAYWHAQAHSAIDFRHDGRAWVHTYDAGWVYLEVARAQGYDITVRVGNTAGC